MLMRSRSTSTLVALCASARRRLPPPCSTGDVVGGGVGNGLDVLVRVQVIICPRNGRKLPLFQIRDRLLESSWIDVGIIRAAPITRPPTGVDGKLHQVG